MKFCRDCIHYCWSEETSPGCAMNPDPVSGSANYASYARRPDGVCGPEARLFEQRPPPPEPRPGIIGLLKDFWLGPQ